MQANADTMRQLVNERQRELRRTSGTRRVPGTRARRGRPDWLRVPHLTRVRRHRRLRHRRPATA